MTPIATKSIQKVPLINQVGLEFVSIHDIIYFESDKNYLWVKLKSGERKYYFCSLGKVEQLLAQFNCFYRIHHSYIVNINQVKSYKKGDGGEIILDNEERIPVSRNKRSGFLKWVFANNGEV